LLLLSVQVGVELMYLILKLGAESLTCACCLPLGLWVLLIVGRYSAAGWGTYGRVFGTRGSGMKQGYTLKYDSGGVHVELGASVGTLVCCSLPCEAKQNEYLHPSVLHASSHLCDLRKQTRG
jgi:hypothetical protein